MFIYEFGLIIFPGFTILTDPIKKIIPAGKNIEIISEILNKSDIANPSDAEYPAKVKM